VLRPVQRRKVGPRSIIFPKAGEEEKAAEQLKQTIYTQASLFTMHYSLAKLWMHWGITRRDDGAQHR
jgi:acyl transferase domain-containing protein